jgi:hypothetical protein
VLLDDGYWPAFSTTKSRSTNAQWEFVGEGFIKELDFGRVWLRLDENDDDERDDIIGEWKGDTKTFLEETLVSLGWICVWGAKTDVGDDRIMCGLSSSSTRTVESRRLRLRLDISLFLCGWNPGRA